MRTPPTAKSAAPPCMADPEWQGYLKRSAEAGYLENQVTKLMLPAKFAPIVR